MQTFPTSLVLAGIVAFAGVARAEDGSSSTGLFRRGVEAFSQEDYDTALDLFERSYAANPADVVLYNIGMCQRALFRYVESVDAFERYLAAGGDDVPAERREEVLRLVGEMNAQVGTLRVSVAPAGAEVLIDGRAVMPEQLERLRLRAGLHALAARAWGHVDAEREVRVEPQVITDVSLSLEPVDASADETAAGGSDVGAAGTEPEDVGGAGTEPEEAVGVEPRADTSRRGVHRQWWFWTVVGVVVVATGLGLGLGLGLAGDDPLAGADIEWRLP
jgi:hypothetical protein